MSSASQGAIVASADASAPKLGTPMENLRRVRDHIAKLPGHLFDMGDWGSQSVGDCGTAACIGGWAERLLFGVATSEWLIAEALGLDDDQGHSLFYMTNTRRGLDDADNAAAVRVLDHLIATGEVDWNVAFPDGSAATTNGNSGMQE